MKIDQELPARAREYVDLGLRVIPLNGKAPHSCRVHTNGLYGAVSTAEGIEAAFGCRLSPVTGIGILTGGPYFVVDIDGEEGAQAWLDIAGELDYLPERWVAKTGRGLHLWFADWPYAPESPGRRTRKLGEKLDLKGAGGYVAAPPSLHPDGHFYTWLRDPHDGPPFVAPDALLALLDEQDELDRQRIVTRAQRKPARGPRWSPEYRVFHPSWGFEGIFEKMRTAGEGNRNATLYWAAFALAEDGADEEDYVTLAAAAQEAGLKARETRLTIHSAQEAYARG